MSSSSTLLTGTRLQSPLESIATLAPVEPLHWPQMQELGIEVAIKREDLLDPLMGGNKFYKLYYHMRAMRRAGLQQALSFGGAYSNHLLALAAAGHSDGFRTVGIVRGETPAKLSATLEDAARLGMQLIFVSRGDYRQKEEPRFLHQLQEKIGPFHCIPEGGGDLTGARGVQVWAKAAVEGCPFVPTLLCAAAGTGSTLSGLLAAPQQVPVLGVLALKGRQEEVTAFERAILLRASELAPPGSALPKLSLATGFHCGGYARYPQFLAEFIRRFEAVSGVPVDPVYTAKLVWALYQLAKTGAIERGARLLIFHSGGLQGRRGYPDAF